MPAQQHLKKAWLPLGFGRIQPTHITQAHTIDPWGIQHSAAAQLLVKKLQAQDTTVRGDGQPKWYGAPSWWPSSPRWGPPPGTACMTPEENLN